MGGNERKSTRGPGKPIRLLGSVKRFAFERDVAGPRSRGRRLPTVVASAKPAGEAASVGREGGGRTLGPVLIHAPLPLLHPNLRGALVSAKGGLSLRVLPPVSPDADPALRDRSGRGVGYLRLSVTGNCSMRCGYCRPAVDANRPEPHRLEAGDVAFLVGHLHGRFGLRKVRLTGGEPTTRPDLPELVKAVRAAGVEEVAITTNGLTLERDARRLADAGLTRANVSLDTLDAGRFAELTGVAGLERVLRGVEAARSVFPGGVKLNAVVIKGHNDGDDLLQLAAWAAERGLALRFIELMPMGPLAGAWAGRYVPAAAMKQTLRAAGVSLEAEPEAADAARRFRALLPGGARADLGFITPMSCNFCERCDRLRVSADGDLHPCLMDEARGNIGQAVRERNAGEIDRLLAAAFERKAAEHPEAGPAIMTRMGG